MSDIIFLMDQDERVIGTLSNEAEAACPYYNDRYKEDLETGAETYEFYVPADHPDAVNIKDNGYIMRMGFHGKLVQFQISRIEEVTAGESIELFVFAEFAWVELNGNIVRPYSLPGTDTRTAAEYALAGTRWQIGDIDYFENFDLENSSYDTSLKMIQDIKAAIGAEIRFYVEMKNNEITGRYVDIVERVGGNKGQIIAFEKNLTDAKRIRERAGVATALIGVGKGNEAGENLTFTNVEWKISEGDPLDKPRGQDWIGDEEARERWGIKGQHITKIFEYETTSPEVLLQKTYEKLQDTKNGFLQYEATAAFLSAQGFDMSDAGIGETVIIQDHRFKPELLVQARIITLDRSFTDPGASTATFGNYETLFSNSAKISEIQSKLLKNETKWGAPPEIPDGIAEIIRTPIEPENKENVIWIDPATDSRPWDLIKTWNPDTGQWDTAANLEGSQQYSREQAEAAKKAAEQYAATARTAAEQYAAAQAAAARIEAEAHADGLITAEEAARIKQAASNLEAARTYAREQAAAAQTAAQTYAAAQAQTAQAAAEEYALLQAELAQAEAQAHADGLVTAEEQARLDQAAENLRDAKTYAENEAAKAEAAAEAAAQTFANEAKKAAQEYAAAQATAARTAAEAHADGIVTAEEQARIDQASKNLAAAKTYAEQQAAAEAAAAEQAAKGYTETYAEKIIIKQNTAPGHLNGRLWLDTSTSPNKLYRSNGTTWIKITPSTPEDIGAESPNSASNKAKVAEYTSLRNMAETQAVETVNRGQIVLDNASYYTANIVTNVRNAVAAVTTQKNALVTAINNAIADNVLSAAEENNISTLKTQFDNAVSTATKAIQASTQDAGGLKVGVLTGITLQVASAGVTNDGTTSGFTGRPIRFWAGANYLNRESAPFRVNDLGEITLTNIYVYSAGNADGSNPYQAAAKLYGSLEFHVNGMYDKNGYRISWGGRGESFIGPPTVTENGYADPDSLIISANNKLELRANSIELPSNITNTTLSVKALTASGKITGGSAQFGSTTLGSTTATSLTVSGTSYHSSLYATNTLQVSGGVTFSSGGDTYYSNGIFTTRNTESGYCGVGAWNPSSGGTGSNLAGVGVNFRVKKTYTPNSVTLTTLSSVLGSSQAISTTQITSDGFWLYILGSQRLGYFVYWRGYYNA